MGGVPSGGLLIIGQSGSPGYKLLATGQTTSYGSGTGVDDGALRVGQGKAYSILTNDQYSGTTDIVVNGKTDTHSNNCVKDLNTGLMWSRYVSASVGPASDGKLPWTTTGSGGTAEGIFTYCAAANAAGLAGYSDWRIPNALELINIADFEAVAGLPDSTAFPSWPITAWSSTTQPNATTSALYVAFNPASIVSAQAKTGNFAAPLVRG